jgi:two-component system, chemotaxis family, chemotaxis protein CheY
MKHAAAPNGATILLVEDDAGIRETLKDVLEDQGYQVVTAHNGQAGLERLREIGKPSLILLDLMMPVMNGEEFLSAVRQNQDLASIPVVAVSAWPKEAMRLRGGTRAFIEKPISLKRLLTIVEGLCTVSTP